MKAINAIFKSTQSSTGKSCKDCKPFRSISEMAEVLRTLSPPKPQNSRDVYEFDAQTDDSARPTPFHSQRNRRKSTAQDASGDDNSARNKNKVFLGMFPEHAVEVTVTSDDILKASLTPRSQTPVQDRSLQGNEDLFNNLLQSLSRRPASSPKPTPPKKRNPSGRKRTVPSKLVTSLLPSATAAAKRSKYKNPLMQRLEEKKSTTASTEQIVEAPTFQLTEAEFTVSIDLIIRTMPLPGSTACPKSTLS